MSEPSSATYVLRHGVSESIVVTVRPFGATITSVLAPDAAGQHGEVVLGFDSVEPYADGRSPYFGCVAGRVANRTALGAFELDGSSYSLAVNNGAHHLHGRHRPVGRFAPAPLA